MRYASHELHQPEGPGLKELTRRLVADIAGIPSHLLLDWGRRRQRDLVLDARSRADVPLHHHQRRHCDGGCLVAGPHVDDAVQGRGFCDCRAPLRRPTL